MEIRKIQAQNQAIHFIFNKTKWLESNNSQRKSGYIKRLLCKCIHHRRSAKYSTFPILSCRRSPVEYRYYVKSPVRSKLNKINPHKSPGNDKWHPYFLRKLSDTICVPLSILLKKALKEGTHESWLTATITAIYKKGLRSVPGNYRAVNITSVVSQIMETIVRDQIVAHMVKHNLLTNDQHGFVHGRYCITQLCVK